MKKVELINRVALEFPSLLFKNSEIIVDTLFDTVTKALAKGDRVDIRGLGSFKIKERRARIGRNPRTGEPVRIPPKRIVHFKVGKELKEQINLESTEP